MAQRGADCNVRVPGDLGVAAEAVAAMDCRLRAGRDRRGPVLSAPGTVGIDQFPRPEHLRWFLLATRYLPLAHDD